MPIALCPAIVHQPSSDRPITPASNVTVSPEATRPESAPLERYRSWTVASSSLIRVISSRSPAGTATRSGTNRIPTALTSTRVVFPVAATATASPPRRSGEEGSTTTATPVASTTTSAAANAPIRFRCLPGAISGRGAPALTRAGFSPASRAAAASRITRSWARTARIITGRRNPRNASDEPTTRVKLVPTGTRKTRSPRLTSTNRNAAIRFISIIPARTAAGPPRITVGMRKLIAPNRTWAAAPARSGTVTAPRSSTRPSATSHADHPTATGNHTSPHPMLIDANSRGGAERAMRAR